MTFYQSSVRQTYPCQLAVQPTKRNSHNAAIQINQCDIRVNLHLLFLVADLYGVARWWSCGVVGLFGGGMVVWWGGGVMGWWGCGVVGMWRGGVVGLCGGGVVVWLWCGGVVEWWGCGGGGVAEWWGGGVVGMWSDGVVGLWSREAVVNQTLALTWYFAYFCWIWALAARRRCWEWSRSRWRRQLQPLQMLPGPAWRMSAR